LSEPVDYPLRGLRILVTGATGLIGLPLCRSLAVDNEVFAAARLRDEAEAQDLKTVGAIPVPFDMASSDLSSLPNEIDVVFHLAARTQVRDAISDDNQRLSIEVNGFGTARLVSKYRSARAFVFASTSSVYTPRDRLLLEEDTYGVPKHFEDGYSLSKIIGEALVNFLSEEWNVPAVILRICQMYGPRGGAPTVRIDQVRRGEPIPIYGDDANLVSILFEDDYVEKFALAATVAAVPPVVVNFAGTNTTIQEYCEIAAELLGTSVEFVTSSTATKPIPVDLTRMHALLGPPKTTVRESVRRTLLPYDTDRAAGWGSLRLPGG
jgi:UDP-glucuronate 4-epimerase